ncbi:single-stranded DNA-binding protein [Pseudomonas aeruginosa]|uniref:single-stranded DNA-binding protein n=1 Tax=Pseudomonas aeruginosa TaxID=287 RepID=UPI0034E08607
MSRGVCKVFLIGWAGADGDLRYTPNGNPVLRVRIATETGVKRGAGQRAPDWHSVVVTGPKAEARENVVRKGCVCYVEGTLRTREHDGKSVSRRRTEVFVGADGVFTVYDDASPSGQEPPASTRPTLDSALSPAARHPGSVLAPARQLSSSGPSELSFPDDDWPSFEGLLLNDLPDTPD